VIRRATRDSVDGRAYLDLQNLARRQGRPTDELHQMYALEGFLARLVASPVADRFVFKGGVLLAAYESRRPTRDIDLQGRHMSNNVDDILELVRAVAAIDLRDGLRFDAGNATAESIRDGDTYQGVRVTINGRLSVARVCFHVDVNVGDPIWPAPQLINLPRLLAGSIAIRGYPVAMVHAEKLVTAVHRGRANTRWRDFSDVYALAIRHNVVGSELTAALAHVATHRRVELAPLRKVLAGYAEQAQTQWTTWRRKHRLDGHVPSEFAEVLGLVIAFADPVIAGSAIGLTWIAADLVWNAEQVS
jgi:predicted nucleotidyltransferase component of viral defense system